jgi:type II secretory pathway component PulF
MARFRYRAKTAQGETVSGVLAGESREAVLGRLEGQALFPVEILPALPEAREGGWAPWRWRVRGEDITQVYRQLADLLGAGVPLLVALASISAQTSNATLLAVITALEADVAEGESLATALTQHPRYFSSLEANLVQAAEAGGFLPGALERVAAFREKRQAVASRVKTAMVYPAALLSVGSVVVGFLMVWVVPRFESIFSQMAGQSGEGLPAPTRVLLGLSRWLGSYWLLVVAVVALAFFAYRRFRERPGGRETVDRFTLGLPVVGRLVLLSGIARFSRTLGLLLAGGVPVLRSLSIASGGAGNLVLEHALEGCTESVREGESLAEPLRTTGVIPLTVVEMVAIGEQSAKLPTVLERIADSYDAQVDRTLTVLVSLLEPAMLVLMAAMVGFVVFALLLPVFRLSSLVR